MTLKNKKRKHLPQFPENDPDIVSGSAQQGIDFVSQGTCKVIPVQLAFTMLRLQSLDLSLGMFALPSMQIATCLEVCSRAKPGVTLTKRKIVLLGQPDQPFTTSVVQPGIRRIMDHLVLHRSINCYPFQAGALDNPCLQVRHNRLLQDKLCTLVTNSLAPSAQ